jgi:hypothetical protein
MRVVELVMRFFHLKLEILGVSEVGFRCFEEFCEFIVYRVSLEGV